jgi:hypothetical protein
MSFYAHHHPVDDPRVDALDTEVTTRRFAFSPGQITGGIVGVIETVIAVLAVTRSGIDNTLNTPVVNVVGLHQSAAVGLGELVLGLLLIAGAVTVWNREIMGIAGGLMFVGGLVVAAASPHLLANMGTDHRSGWWVMLGGVIAMISAALPVFERYGSRRRVV